MKKLLVLGLLLLVTPHPSFAQFSGGAGMGGGFGGNAGGGSVYRSNDGNSPTYRERNKRTMGTVAATPNVTFLDAGVLMNVKADEYVAVFAIVEEAPTVVEANTKMDATVAKFKEGLRAAGVKDDDCFVDFIVQNRVYNYRLIDTPNSPRIAQEELTGYELKKNVSIRFQDKDRLDALVAAATQAQIFDLVKVDYVVKDAAAIQARLNTEAARIIRNKLARHEALLGLKLSGPTQVVVDSPSVYYPIEQYRSYTAAEAEDIDTPNGAVYTIKRTRKSRTFYFEPLSGDGFDLVINPVIIEPVVQFTAYLRVRYETNRGGRRR